MRESRAYLNFFKKNFLVFTLPVLISIVLAFWFVQTRGVDYKSRQGLAFIPAPLEQEYKYTRLFEMKYDQTNVEQKKLEADELVALLRSDNLQGFDKGDEGYKGDRGDEGVSKAGAYKAGPLSFYLRVTSRDKELAKRELDGLVKFVQQKSQVNEVGVESFEMETEKVLIPVLVILIGGFLLGLVLSLMRSYFEKY